MNQQDEKTSNFLLRLKTEYDMACKLKDDRQKLLDIAYSNTASYEYMNDIERSYDIQMLQLRDRLLRTIKEYFYGK